MMKLKAILVVAIFATVAAGVFAQNSTPTQTVSSFYKFDRSRSQLFNRRSIDTRKKWLSPRFYNLFREELRKEKAHLKIHPTDKPFFGDGFSFSPRDEACNANGHSMFRKYVVQRSVLTGSVHAEVPVKFFYPKPCTMEAIIYKVKLVKTNQGWVIDDLIYDDGASFSMDMKQHHY